MKITIRIIGIFAILSMASALSVAQSDLLDSAEHMTVSLPINDVVYDRIRDVLYASIPSAAGAPYADSIATIDPATGGVLDSIYVGSAPNTLAISGDASRVYVGIDGEASIRWWQPADGQLGDLRQLLSYTVDPGVAHDMAVPPGRPNIVVVSIDEVGSTANGHLEVFSDTGSMRGEFGILDYANYIGFVDATTLVGFDDSNTGFRAHIRQLDDLTLSIVKSKSNVVNNFDVEAEVGSDGLVYFTDGTVLDGHTLDAVGPYTTGLVRSRTLVEPVPALGLTYFVGPVSNTITSLKAFDSQSFLEIDSVDLPFGISDTDQRGELISAGHNRLAFLWKPQTFDGPGGSGTLHIVSGVPVEVVPEPATASLAILLLLAGGCAMERKTYP